MAARRQVPANHFAASWAPTPAHCEVDVDWTRLGLHPRQVAARAPRVATFQEAAEFAVTAARTLRVSVQPARGTLIVLHERR